MKAIDATVSYLCEEIDDLKAQARYWKNKYDDLLKEHNEQLVQREQESRKALGNAIAFAFAFRDDKDGNLVIDRDSRKTLALRHKSEENEIA